MVNDMHKGIKILLGLCSILLILSVFLSTRYYINQHKIHEKSQNIFDEMYYGEISSSTNFYLLGKTHLGTKRNIATHKRAKTSEGAEIYEAANFVEVYQKTSKPISSINLAFYVPPKSLYKNGYLKINIGYQMKDGKTINILYSYSLKNRIVTRQVVQNYWQDDYSENKLAVFQTLSANHLSLSDVYHYGDKVLKTKVLKDWCSVYNSRYSPSHWGKVKIVNTWKNAKE